MTTPKNLRFDLIGWAENDASMLILFHGSYGHEFQGPNLNAQYHDHAILLMIVDLDRDLFGWLEAANQYLAV